MNKVLITGASGLIGTRLQEMLIAKGYEIHTTGREAKPPKNKMTKSFGWDVARQQMDAAALSGVGTIIHLAGAGVADKRWTEERKKEIMDSRVESTRLLYKTLKENEHKVKTIVSASAVGYYGDCGDEIVTEEHHKANNFLADVVRRWEEEVSKMEQLNIRHVCCRIGIVLAKDGGALPELVRTFPVGVAGYFAKDPLYYPWVHIDDVCGIMIHGMEKESLRGSYNTTGPGPVKIKELVAAIKRAKKSHAILVPVPPFALKLAMGEMSEMILCSQRCSDEKIRKTGYQFYFPGLNKALENIYGG